MAQLASALRSGRRGRPFEPDHPDIKKAAILSLLFLLGSDPLLLVARILLEFRIDDSLISRDREHYPVV